MTLEGSQRDKGSWNQMSQLPAALAEGGGVWGSLPPAVLALHLLHWPTKLCPCDPHLFICHRQYWECAETQWPT